MNMTDNIFWKAPSDGLQTARLYESVEQPQQNGSCGHSVPLHLMVERIRQQQQQQQQQRTTASCPLCGSKVLYITDGQVGDDDDDDESVQQRQRQVVFKYGKQVYRLTVPPPSSLQKILSGRFRLLDDFLMAALPATTAQSRIAQALQLDLQRGMKILYQGKVLYPTTSSSSSSGTTTRSVDEFQLSKLLMQMNHQNGYHHRRSLLLVMGTPMSLPRRESLLQRLWVWVWSCAQYIGRNSVSLLLLGRPCHHE